MVYDRRGSDTSLLCFQKTLLDLIGLTQLLLFDQELFLNLFLFLLLGRDLVLFEDDSDLVSVLQLFGKLLLLLIQNFGVVVFYFIHVVYTEPQTPLATLGQNDVGHVRPRVAFVALHDRLIRVKAEI